MKYKSFDDYREEILGLYKKNRGGDLKVYLFEPTPAKIKKACSQIFSKIKSKADKEIIDVFFGLNKDDDKVKKIKVFNNGELKSIQNFLTDKTNKTETETLDLVALLIGFKLRPYIKYYDEHKFGSVPEEIKGPTITGDEGGKSEEDGSATKTDITEEPPKEPWLKKLSYIMLPLLIAAGVYFGVNQLEKKECMIWSVDHYEKADCNVDSAASIAMDQHKIESFKRVPLDSTMNLFKNGKSLYWYDKTNGEITFFSDEGNHPVNGKKLKRLTQAIVRKYIYFEK